MKKTDELFLLIQSLKKHEKRFFKLSVSTNKSETQYMKMFDLIEVQKKYDEKEVVEKMGMNKNHFAFQKNYLYRLVLESMVLLHKDKKSEIRKLLTQADFLYKKGLYSQHEKILSKAKKLAQDYALSNYLPEISNMEHTLAWKDNNLDLSLQAMREKKQALEDLQLEAEYHGLANEIIVKLVKGGSERDIKKRKGIEALLNNPLFKDEKLAKTFRCKNLVYHTRAIYSNVAGDFQSHYRFAKKNISLFLSDSEKVKQFPETYLYALDHIINACNTLKKFSEVKYYLGLLSKEFSQINSEREKTWAFYTYHRNNLLYYINSGQFKEGIAPAEELAKELPAYKTQLEYFQNVYLYLSISIIYFGAEKYSACIHWLNEIRMKESTLRIRPFLENTVRIFYLIAHFEKGNTDLMPSLTASLQRYLSSKERLFQFEKILLKYLGKELLKYNSKKEMVEQFGKLRKELLPIEKYSAEKALFADFDYIAWIESKIENKSFAEIVQRKSRDIN